MASLSQLIPLPPTVIEVKTLAANEIHFLTSHFSAFNLSYVCRHCNKIAHSFVNKKIKNKNSFPPLSVWMEDVLLDIIYVLQADLNNLP